MKSIFGIKKNQMPPELWEKYRACYYGFIETVRAIRGPLVPVYYAKDMALLILMYTRIYSLPEVPVYLRRRRRHVIVNESTTYMSYINTAIVPFTVNYSGNRFLGNVSKKAARMAYLYNPHKMMELERLGDMLISSRKSFVVDSEVVGAHMGRIMAEIFAWKEDLYEKELSDIGYYCGKLTFYMEAYERINESQKRDSYNPLLYIKRTTPEVFDAYVLSAIKSNILELEAAFARLEKDGELSTIKAAIIDSLNNRYEKLKTKRKIR